MEMAENLFPLVGGKGLKTVKGLDQTSCELGFLREGGIPNQAVQGHSQALGDEQGRVQGCVAAGSDRSQRGFGYAEIQRELLQGLSTVGLNRSQIFREYLMLFQQNPS